MAKSVSCAELYITHAIICKAITCKPQLQHELNNYTYTILLCANTIAARMHIYIHTAGTPESPRASLSAAQAHAMSSAGGSSSNPSARATTFTLLPPDEFLPFVVPFQGGPGPLAGEFVCWGLHRT